MLYAPINAITWTIGSIPTTRFGIKGLMTYRKTKSPFSRRYGLMAVLLGFSFFMLGVPPLFTQDVGILHITSFIADVFVQAGLQVLVWLLWFIGLRKYFKLSQLLSVSIIYSVVLLTIELMTSHVIIQIHPSLVQYVDKPIVLILKSIIYLALALPLGFFFLAQVPKAPDLIAKLKSVMTAMVFILVSVAATANNIFDKGSDTVSSATTLAIFFTVFLFISLIPSRSEVKGKK